MMSAGNHQQDSSKEGNANKGKEKFKIPSDESDDAWIEGDVLSDVSMEEGNEGPGSEEEFEVVDEDPFEPVYATPSAEADGITIEAVSLDNILPAGSRRRPQPKRI